MIWMILVCWLLLASLLACAVGRAIALAEEHGQRVIRRRCPDAASEATPHPVDVKQDPVVIAAEAETESPPSRAAREREVAAR